MKIIIKLILILLFFSCNSSLEKWKSYDETQEISKNSSSENQKLRYKRIQSISADKNKLINGLENEIENFIKTKYDMLKPKILEKKMTTKQKEYMYITLMRLLRRELMGELFKVIFAFKSEKNDFLGFK